MTASDPAVAAAERAMESRRPGEGAFDALDMRAAAREALAPLRELHKPHTLAGWEDEPFCRTCAHELLNIRDLEYQPWPCDTARLIYREDEL